MSRLLLNDRQWQRIEPMVAKDKNARGGRPQANRRKLINGIFWILRTGAPWRDMPREFGSWQTAWRLFDQWNGEGILDRILQSLQATRIGNRKSNHELWCVDGSVIRAARCSAGGGKKGIRKSRKTTH